MLTPERRRVTGRRPIIALLALWAVGGVMARAQGDRPEDYRVAHWTTAEGLPQNTINDIVALPNGELWLATYGGLVRFDGTEFRVIDIAGDDGLVSNRITALAQAGTDTFWYVTQEGHLGRIEGSQAHAVLDANSSMPDTIGMLAARGQFYVQTLNGDIWTSDGTSPWQVSVRASDDWNGGFNFLTRSRTGRPWAIFGRAVVALTAKAGMTPTRLPVLGLAAAGGIDGELWLGLPNGVAHYVNGRVDTLDVRPGLDSATTAVLYVSDNELWVAGDGAVSHLTTQPDGTWHRVALPIDLPNAVPIRALSLDVEGSLWVGTSGRGLYRVHRDVTRRFGPEVGIAGIEALVSDGKDGAWASASCASLVLHIDAIGTVEPMGGGSPGEPSGCENSYAAAPGGDAWVRSRSEIFRVRRTAPRFSRLPITLPDEAGPIVATPGGTLWVASRSGDLRHVEADRVIEHVTLPGPLVSLSLGPDGTLWVGGSGEIFHLPGGGRPVERIGAAQGMPRGWVRDILIDRDGTVWIATYGGGLGHLRNGRMTRFTMTDGLTDNSLSRILDDGQGRIWLSTNRGTVVLDRAEIAEVLAGAQRVLTPIVLGAERGVAEANFGMPAGFVDPRGRIWLGTIDGAVRIDANRFPFNRLAPRVRVDGIFADERRLPLGDVVKVPAGTSRVRLNFGAMSLRYPERLRFRYRIEGIDRDWVDIGGQRFATFTPAAPGNHRFLLQARNEDGVWSVAPIAVELAVMPAWWQTSAARLAALGAAVMVVFGFYRLRVQALEERHHERVRAVEERRRAEAQASALRGQLEHVSRLALAGELTASLAHEVKQPLQAIVANAEVAEHMVAAGQASGEEFSEVLHDIVAQGIRASEVIGELREFLRPDHSEMGPLDLSQLVREMLPLMRREFEDHDVAVRVDLLAPAPAVEGRRVQLEQVIANLLMNACEALAQVEGARRVTVTTRTSADRVEVVVSDNGPGLQPEIADRLFEPFVSTKPKGMGMGLAISRSIIETHRGRLIAEPAAGGGLTVVMSLPQIVG
jgi:signal transduction histidine kinase/ligand-binding sensor domain-containing protein